MGPPPFLAHYVGFFNIGPKIGPPPGPPFLTCRPKMPPPPFCNPGSAPANGLELAKYFKVYGIWYLYPYTLHACKSW